MPATVRALVSVNCANFTRPFNCTRPFRRCQVIYLGLVLLGFLLGVFWVALVQSQEAKGFKWWQIWKQ